MDRSDFDESLPPKQNCTGTFTENRSFGWFVKRLDRRRGTEEPWLVFSGDSLLIGDVGRPDLHVAGDARGQARLLHASLQRLLELPDHVVLYPSHYAGSVCGRSLSGNARYL